MSNPPSHPGRPVQAEKSCGRPLTVLELTVVLEELDRVVDEMQESLTELALPFDESACRAAREAIAVARSLH